MAEVPLPCLCLVTDRHRCEGRRLEAVVEAAVCGGVNLIQLREKDLAAGKLLALARRLRDLTKGRALLFVNDRIDVALACEADGVQLGEEGLPLEVARDIARGRLLLGRSVHSVEGAVAAEVGGADLLVVGAIFPTGSHPGVAAAGVELLDRIRRRVGIPVLAIGGVKAQTVKLVIGAGASGAAVITAITQSPDPKRAAEEIMAQMRAAWSSSPLGETAKPA